MALEGIKGRSERVVQDFSPRIRFLAVEYGKPASLPAFLMPMPLNLNPHESIRRFQKTATTGAAAVLHLHADACHGW